MERFGPFTIGKLLSDSEVGVSLYEATKEGDPKGRYALKLVSPQRLDAEPVEAAALQRDPAFTDPGAGFLQRVDRQKQAAASSPFFAPILAAGQDERGVWYVTRFYTNSVKGKLDRFVVLEAPDLFHVVQSVVRAARHLQATQGCSHGNLQPTNIFIDGPGKPRNSPVVVADPQRGDADQARQFELADLRSIGELIFQLAVRRKVDFAWVTPPLEATPEWAQVFGNKAPGWLELCNRLLAPNLSLAGVTLDRLEQELEALKPRAPLPVVPIAVGLGVLLVAGMVVFLVTRPREARLMVTLDPPDARLVIAAVTDDENKDPIGAPTTNVAPAGKFESRLQNGRYKLRAEFGDLDPLRAEVVMRKGVVFTTNFTLAYGRLNVESQPPGADFTLKNHSFQTPTNIYYRPGAVSFQLNLKGFETMTVTNAVPSNGQSVNVVVAMKKPAPGSGLVALASDPIGAALFLDGANDAFLEKTAKESISKSIQEGTHTIVAKLPPFEDVSLSIDVKTNQTPPQALTFHFKYGVLSVTNTDPPVVQVFLDGKPMGASPTNVVLAPGKYSVALWAAGYDTNTDSVEVADKTTTSPRGTKLKALDGFVEVSSDPPGAAIRDKADKVLATTSAGEVTRIPLPPGRYDLKATFGELKAVDKTGIDVKAGQTVNAGRFSFDYGALVFVGVFPTNASIRSVDQPGLTGIPIGQPVIQKPGLTNAFLIEALGYESCRTNLWVENRKTNQIGVSLARTMMPVAIPVDPPGAKLFLGGINELVATEGAGVYRLPPEKVLLVANHPRLGSLTNEVEIKLGVSNVVAPFKFSYGTLYLTNLAREITNVAEVIEGKEAVVGSRASRVSYEKLGAHTYVLQSRFASEIVVTNIAVGDNWLLSTNRGNEVIDSIGMLLVRVSDVLGPGKDGWVGKFEVTQKEYEEVMGAKPSAHAGGLDLPVENVTWAQAKDFCEKLTQKDLTAGMARGEYRLPTLEEWNRFAEGTSADAKDAVVNTSQPAPVGSKRPNDKGLCDVFGNVMEWLWDGDGTNNRYLGAAFSTRFNIAVRARQPEERSSGWADGAVGFRVLLVPAQ